MSTAVAVAKPNGHAALAAVRPKERKAPKKKPKVLRRLKNDEARKSLRHAIRTALREELQYHDVIAQAQAIVVDEALRESKGDKTRAGARLGLTRDGVRILRNKTGGLL